MLLTGRISQPPYNNNVVFDGSSLVPGVGLIQATQTPSRQIQLGLKLIW